MDSLHKLQEIFTHFPGIGPRQARRFVYYLLNKPPSSLREFTQLIEEVKKSTSECEQCHRIFVRHSNNQKLLTINHLCSICTDTSRDQTTLLIIARDSDFESIEKSGAYKGLYFILGGTIPILDKEPEKRIRLEKLLERVSHSDPSVPSEPSAFKEIILSLNTTPDGEHTAEIVKGALQKVTEGRPTKISILGRGLSTGAELEYVDAETIKNALSNRR